MTEKIFEDFNSWVNESDMPNGKRKVLLAAVDLFAEQGFDGTSTAQISAVSGMSEGTIFKYFKTKRHILTAILDPFIGSLLPSYGQDFIQNQLPKNVEFTEFIQIGVKNRLTFIYTNRKMLQIFFSELMVNEAILTKIKQQMAPIAELAVVNFRRFTAQTSVEPLDIIRLIVGQLIFEFMRMTKFDTGEAYQIDEAADKIAKSVILMVN